MFIAALGRGALCLLLATSVVACGDDEDITSDPSAESFEQAMHEAAEMYQAIAYASYRDSYDKAKELDEALSAFVADPSEGSLSAARKAWLAAREPYLQTEVFRFYQGPIDNEETGVEGLVNAWPLDESYIDYVEGEAQAGIINAPEVPISAESLAELNEQGGEDHIATGYHAIEFLLWGQDRSESGPGDRPYTDYVSGDEGTHENQDRRAEYLLAASALLLKNLGTVVAAWEPGEDNYREQFEQAEPEEQLRRILTGMITLSGFETGGERLQTALDTGDQEDEHSCFSDNTHRDMVQDIQGVWNVYGGSYTTTAGDLVEGASLLDVVKNKNEGLGLELEGRITESLELALELERPFDREISPDNAAGRARVQALIESLQLQEQLLQEVFRDFELAIPETPQ